MTDPRDVERALTFLDSTDRATWIRVGMAVRAGLGDDEGKPLWMAWSATSAKFDARAASRAWDSFRSHSITIGTLFGLAQAAGFRFEKRERDEDYARRRREQARRQQATQQRDQAQREQRHEAAARTAQAMVERATYGPHPYLEAKGLGSARGLVLDGALLVPMRDHQTGRVMAVQVIQPDGAKKYQPAGCRTAGTIHALGKRRGRMVWYCEGYATGLSILAGLEAVYHTDVAVVVCFSAGQLARIAKPDRSRLQFVCADNDWFHCKAGHRWGEPHDACPECGAALAEPAGEQAAKATGLPWWMPDRPGTDANDVFVEHGAAFLGQELLGIRRLALDVRRQVMCRQPTATERNAAGQITQEEQAL